ncbi:MAG: hypothetical protein WAM14_07950 [Candidatus Nitrosopolaris sp.]
MTIPLNMKMFMHHPAPIVWGSSGSTILFQRFKEQSFIAAQKYKDAIQWFPYRDRLEDITKRLNKRYPSQEYEFEVFIAGQGQFIDGTMHAMLYQIHTNGSAHLVKKYRAIGSGEPYGSIFLKKCWGKEMLMQDVAKLGCFIIRYIEVNELDRRVGLDKNKHPQIYYIPNQGKVREASEEELNAIRNKVDEWLGNYNNQIANLFN